MKKKVGVLLWFPCGTDRVAWVETSAAALPRLGEGVFPCGTDSVAWETGAAAALLRLGEGVTLSVPIKARADKLVYPEEIVNICQALTVWLGVETGASTLSSFHAALTVWLGVETGAAALSSFHAALTLWLGVETGAAAALPRLGEGVTGDVALPRLGEGVTLSVPIRARADKLVYPEEIVIISLTVWLGVETGAAALPRLGEGVGCFFRQFYRSVGKADYLALCNGFITVHLAPGSKFNFQKYIKRSLEDDFKVVVGVSPVLWASFVVFLLLNVNGWYAMFWASLIPVVIILAVGTKHQVALAKMAIEITERHAVVQGSDRYFWFGRLQLYSFGLRNCFHADYKFAIVKVALGLAALCLCSNITLPLYALVTQASSCVFLENEIEKLVGEEIVCWLSKGFTLHMCFNLHFKGLYSSKVREKVESKVVESEPGNRSLPAEEAPPPNKADEDRMERKTPPLGYVCHGCKVPGRRLYSALPY
ncbi:hypothetical protein VNO80_08898 [Phaseolus coccineus]|uniref:MLO-like protein n=1 Tax=Phaseolus coccineus TaxID=3886 RepID=A0AAN9N5B6_PHACN